MRIEKLGLEKGEWIVHPNHGVGQISRLEEKTIQGETRPYLRVRGPKYVWWIAVEEIDESPIRPLRKPATFRRALRVLKELPEPLPQGFRERRAWIREMMSKASPASLCRVVRNLSASNREKRLHDRDLHDLRTYRDALLQEWQLTLDVPEPVAAETLDEYLAESWAISEELSETVE